MSTADQPQCPNCLAPKLPWQGADFTCTDCGVSFSYVPPADATPLKDATLEELERVHFGDADKGAGGYEPAPSGVYAIKLGKQHGTEEAHRVKHLLKPMNQEERILYFSAWWSVVIVHMKAAIGPEAARAVTDAMKLLADGDTTPPSAT